MKKIVLISGVGGSLFPYFIEKLEKKYRLVLIDSNDVVKHTYPNSNIIVVPSVKDPQYRTVIDKLIRNLHVDYYIPLIDEEILQAIEIAKTQRNLKLIAPNQSFVQLCLDKFRLMKKLTQLQISQVLTWRADRGPARLSFPVFLKPITSRGSRGARRIDNMEQLQAYFLFESYSKYDVMIQEYLEGEEYTVSVAVNNLNHLIAIVPKQVILKKGITLHAVTRKNEIISAICRVIVDKLKPYGPFNVQLKVCKDQVKIFEVNPRFSTTSVLTCEAGVNEFDLCMKLYGKTSIKEIDSYQEGLFLYRRWENCFYELKP
ncbi:ATP-grasp domain-containing protein [Candidatus Collierbacteria bacterium]|nr:ATP-grasp domain-containing protein [Candidatus Collierbacteria bacterium]